jgi:hypothetical protein
MLLLVSLSGEDCPIDSRLGGDIVGEHQFVAMKKESDVHFTISVS